MIKEFSAVSAISAAGFIGLRIFRTVPFVAVLWDRDFIPRCPPINELMNAGRRIRDRISAGDEPESLRVRGCDRVTLTATMGGKYIGVEFPGLKKWPNDAATRWPGLSKKM